MKVESIIHKAHIEVDRHGTKAAAVSMGVVEKGGNCACKISEGKVAAQRILRFALCAPDCVGFAQNDRG